VRGYEGYLHCPYLGAVGPEEGAAVETTLVLMVVGALVVVVGLAVVGAAVVGAALVGAADVGAELLVVDGPEPVPVPAPQPTRLPEMAMSSYQKVLEAPP